MVSSQARGQITSVLEVPFQASTAYASVLYDLFSFRDNAKIVRSHEKENAAKRLEKYQSDELRHENGRLTALLEMRPAISKGLGKVIYCRVIARSPLAWNKVFLIDKGFNEGLRVNLPVFFKESLAGKIVEVGPSVAKVLLITDPTCKIGVVIQRTRQQGVLYGAADGLCRAKYLSTDIPIQAGDIVETAGLGMFFAKGIPVGTVVKSWKEPGQIYQVAEVRPIADLGLVEEVAVLDQSPAVP